MEVFTVGRQLGLVLVTFALVLSSCGGAASGTDTPTQTQGNGTGGNPSAGETAAGETAAAEPANLRLALNWNVPYSGWVGFYAAQDQGYFEDENLDVEFVLLAGSGPVNQTVAANGAELGVATASSVLVAASQGLPLVSVSAYMQTTPEAVVARADSGIEDLEDFVGKRVAINRANPTVYLFEARLRRAGIDPQSLQWINVQPEAIVTMLLEDDADAGLGYADWQAINLQNEGLDINVFLMSDEEAQIYGPVVLANNEWAAENGDTIRRFLAASVRGWIYARDNPDDMLRIMMEANPEEDEAFMRDAIEATMPLIDSPNVEEHGFGWQEAADWQALHDALLEGDVLETEVDVEPLFTNDYLPDNASDY